MAKAKRPGAGSAPPPEDPSAWQALLEFALDERYLSARHAADIATLQATLEDSDEALAQQLLAWAMAPDGVAVRGVSAQSWRSMLLLLLRRAFALPQFHGAAAKLEPLAAVLAKRSAQSLRPLVGPALRLVIGKPRDGDFQRLDAWLSQIIKETFMADTTFFIDVSAIPILQNPASRDALSTRVMDELQKRFGVPAATADVLKVPSAAVVLGMVVLDGEVDAASSGLPDALRRAWLESIGDIPSQRADAVNGKAAQSEVYKFVAETIPKLNGGISTLAVQEFAFVAREVIAGASSIPFGHPNFESAIRIALDRYVQTRASGDSLSLPAGSLPGGTQNAGGDADLNSDNIRVIGLAYSLALLEKTQILRVADRLAELFMNGLLPFGHDAAGKALDEYYWDSEDRMSEAQRRSQYSRMLGMPGGEVSKEVAPNKDFEQLFLRFIGSVSEFSRQREVDRMFTTRTAVLPMTGEQVRKSAFELAKNASLYAWGGSFYVVTRANRHLERAIALLSQPQVLKTYAASNHWQVVERVSQQDFGGAPNWAKYSTMAQAASTLFNVLANNTAALATTASGRPFLFDPNFNANEGRGDGDLSEAMTVSILTSVQQWLAVNGVRDDQVKQYAQPVELNSSPSLPGGMPSSGNNSMEVVNKLKQLVSSGTPNPDQIQQLLSTLG